MIFYFSILPFLLHRELDDKTKESYFCLNQDYPYIIVTDQGIYILVSIMVQTHRTLLLMEQVFGQQRLPYGNCRRASSSTQSCTLLVCQWDVHSGDGHQPM